MTDADPSAVEREKIVAFMRDAIGRGFDWPRDITEKCEHGLFKWEDCIACYDEYLDGQLEAVLRGDHLRTGRD